jgi:hypothetical protein
MPSSGDQTFEYGAPRWFRVSVVVACLMFVGLLLAAIWLPGLSPIVLWAGIAGTLIGVAGIAEVFVGRVTLESDSLVIRQWYRTDRVFLRDVERVSLEGGLISLRLRAGSWKRLPEWIGANKSLGARIRGHLKSVETELNDA